MNNFLQTISLEEAITLIDEQRREIETLRLYISKIKDSMDNINNYLSILSTTYTINDTTNNIPITFNQTTI